MGSSVFHGGFSTFVSISIIGLAKTYIFEVFYKLWFGIILFGLAHGFLLLPVVLSFIGPTHTVMDHSKLESGSDDEEVEEEDGESGESDENSENSQKSSNN